MPKASVLSNIQKTLDHVEFAAVCEERHEDGTPHLHAYVKFSQKVRYSASVLDALTGQHGNYKAAWNNKGWLSYIMKEDSTPATTMPIQDFLAKQTKEKKGKFDAAAELLQDGKNLRDLNKQMPGFVLQHKRKLEEYQTMLSTESLRSKVNNLVRVEAEIPFVNSSKLVDWLNDNVKMGHLPRAPRQSQLFLYGPPNVGKTRLKGMLEKHMRVYEMPMYHDQYDDYEDGLWDVAVFDEFKGQKPIQWMNRWLDGSSMSLKVRYAQRIKRENVPTIILSNFPPHECYNKATPTQVAPFLDRLTVVQLSAPFELTYVSEEITEDYGYDSGRDPVDYPFDSLDE